MTSNNSRKRVLVVEDDACQAIGLERAAEAVGLKALGPAASVGEALDLAQQSPPDFAVVDFNLGAATGAAIAQHLAFRKVPFVYVTGKSGAHLAEQGVPAAKVFRKPVPPEQVMAFVNAELGLAQSQLSDA